MVSAGDYLSFLSVDKWTIIINLLNTLILYKIIKKFLFQPVNKMIDDRKLDIESDYKDAQEALDKAADLKSCYEEKINKSAAEAKSIVDEAKNRADFKYEEIINEAKNKADVMIKRADEEIKLEKQKLINTIKDEFAEAVVLAATKVINKELSREDHEKLINDCLDGVEEVEMDG